MSSLPQLLIHIVVAKSDGTAHDDHNLESYVRLTLEIVLTEAPAHLMRRPDSQPPLDCSDD